MLYGLYLSAGGVINDSVRQDMIANNLANTETVGFKKDLAVQQERATAAQENPGMLGAFGSALDPMLEKIGGGTKMLPSQVDSSQGELQQTGNPLDVAIQGSGYFAVRTGGKVRLTRDGEFSLDKSGKLTLASNPSDDVLDNHQQPIVVSQFAPVTIERDGTITQNGKAVAQIGTFDVSDVSALQKVGGNLIAPGPKQALNPITTTVRSEFVERSNVDPATELTQLMDTQRQLEANAQMIRYQDETLDKLVNQVGRVS